MAKRVLMVGWIVLFAAGVGAAWLAGSLHLGVVLFALGAILLAVQGYLSTGDRAPAFVLIFVAVVAIGIEAIVYFLGP